MGASGGYQFAAWSSVSFCAAAITTALLSDSINDGFHYRLTVNIVSGMVTCGVLALVMCYVLYEEEPSIVSWMGAVCTVCLTWMLVTAVMTILAAKNNYYSNVDRLHIMTCTFELSATLFFFGNEIAMVWVTIAALVESIKNSGHNSGSHYSGSHYSGGHDDVEQQVFQSSGRSPDIPLRVQASTESKSAAVSALMKLTNYQLKLIWNDFLTIEYLRGASKSEIAGEIVEALGARQVLDSIESWKFKDGAVAQDLPPVPIYSTAAAAPMSTNNVSTDFETQKAIAKDVLSSLSHSHLSDVSKGLGLSVTAQASKPEIVEKILKVLGPDAVAVALDFIQSGGSGGTALPSAPAAHQQPPVSFASAGRAASMSRPGGIECGICFSAMGPGRKPVGVASCGHTFCYDCFVSAVREQSKCPSCRQTMQESEVIRAYI